MWTRSWFTATLTVLVKLRKDHFEVGYEKVLHYISHHRNMALNFFLDAIYVLYWARFFRMILIRVLVFWSPSAGHDWAFATGMFFSPPSHFINTFYIVHDMLLHLDLLKFNIIPLLRLIILLIMYIANVFTNQI